MAAEPRPAFLDRPLARGLAFLVFAVCMGALAWLERERLWAQEVAADDPVGLCIAERSAQIDELAASGRIESGQAELFKGRMRTLCQSAGDLPGPPGPGRPPG